MKTHAGKVHDKDQKQTDGISSQSQGSSAMLQFADNRPQASSDKAAQEMAGNSPQVKQLKSVQDMANKVPRKQWAAASGRTENNTGMPAVLKSGIEKLSGLDMGDVNVHYNSDKPAQLQALAYAQGTEIHVAPGEEQHLPHEAWHVVQQKQGRVRPTLQPKNGVSINDNRSMEHEATSMGSRAISAGAQQGNAMAESAELVKSNIGAHAPVQRLVTIDQGDHNYPVKKQSRSIKKDKTVPNDNSFFVSQDLTNVDQGYSDGPNGLEANLVFKSNADLMLSDALDLAIEADVEAKYFFATKARIKEANSALKGGVRLRATDRYLKITSNGGTLKLFQVEPYVPTKQDHGQGKKGAGLNMRIPQRCNEMSEFVSGKVGVEFSAGILQVFKILASVLTGLPTIVRDFESEFREVLKNIGKAEGNLAYGDLTEEMSVAYKKAINDGYQAEIDNKLSTLRVNKHMDPSIGSSITTFGVGTENENALADKNATFGYHFGAVVAKSGSDYITLENYARRNDKSSGLLSGGDPLFFFRMYGVNSDTDSWHQKALDTNAFVGRAISFVVE